MIRWLFNLLFRRRHDHVPRLGHVIDDVRPLRLAVLTVDVPPLSFKRKLRDRVYLAHEPLCNSYHCMPCFRARYCD